METLIVGFVVYLIGLGILVFLGGRKTFNLGDNIFMVMFWPVTGVLSIVILPFIFLYGLGEYSSKKDAGKESGKESEERNR